MAMTKNIKVIELGDADPAHVHTWRQLKNNNPLIFYCTNCLAVIELKLRITTVQDKLTFV